MALEQRRILKLYTPHPKQLEIHSSKARFRVAATGRQFGKSTLAINEIASFAWNNRATRSWFISPTYSQAKDQYRRLVLLLPPEVIARMSESELRMELINESVIEFKSGEVRENLRGATLHFVGIDEVREQHRDLWPVLIRPMLTTTKGKAIFLSSCNGFDYFYDLFHKADTDADWESFHAPSTANPLFTQEELASARSEMSEEFFAQEIMAEFRDIGSGTCYVSFKVARNVVSSNPFAEPGMLYSPHLPIVVGMDFNLNPMSWVLGQQNKNHMHWEDELILPRTHTEEAANALVQKVMHHPSGLILIGDASGKAGQRAAHAGQSDYDVIKNVLRRNGITWQDRTPDANPGIKDRVNTANSALCSAGGEVRMTFNARMKTTIKDFQRRSWKQGATNLAFDNSDPEIGHASDAATYPVCVLMPIRQIGAVGRIHVISRSF
jgi:hypothetical protein